MELLERYFVEGDDSANPKTSAAAASASAAMAPAAEAAEGASGSATPELACSTAPALPAWPKSANLSQDQTRRQQQQQQQQEQQEEVGPAPAKGQVAAGAGRGGLAVESIFLYPIKSCQGMEAQAWPLGEWACLGLGWLAGWLGWLAGWLAGWLVVGPTYSRRGLGLF